MAASDSIVCLGSETTDPVFDCVQPEPAVQNVPECGAIHIKGSDEDGPYNHYVMTVRIAPVLYDWIRRGIESGKWLDESDCITTLLRGFRS